MHIQYQGEQLSPVLLPVDSVLAHGATQYLLHRSFAPSCLFTKLFPDQLEELIS